MNDPTAQRIDLLRSRNLDAVRLAALVSTAMRVEPELLRRCRLLLPGADVSAEADLWASSIVAAASPVAITLLPEAARHLRAELATFPAPLRDQACELVARQHGDEHWSVRLEEEVNRLDVSVADPALRTGRQEQLLLSAVGELRRAAHTADPTDARGIARWLLAALSRLPARIERSDVGFAALAAGCLQLAGRVPEGAAGTPGERERWLSWLLATAGGQSDREVGVRFTPGVLEINAEPGLDVGVVPLPPTDPVVVDVEVSGPRGHSVTRIRVSGEEPVRVPLDSDQVVLSAIDGRRWTVRRGGVPPAGGLDFSEVRSHLRPCLAREDMVARLLGSERWWTVVRTPPDSGGSTLMNAALDELEGRSNEVVTAVHFFGRVAAWDEPAVITASLESQLRATLPAWVEVPDPSDDPSGRRLWDVLSQAGSLAGVSGRRVVVVLDDVPGSSVADAEKTMWRLPFPSHPPSGVTMLAGMRFPGGLRNWLETGDPITMLDLEPESEPVCRAMLERATLMLERSLASSFATAGTELLSEPGSSPSDALLAHSGASPGRLARLLAWIGRQPPRTVRLDRLPPTLVVDGEGVWRRLQDLHAELAGRYDVRNDPGVRQYQYLHGLVQDGRIGLETSSAIVRTLVNAAAVARPGCTVGDVARLVPPLVGDDGVEAAFRRLPELFRLGGQDWSPDKTVEVVDPSVAVSPQVDQSAGHAAFAERWRYSALTPSSAYELRNAAYHAAAIDESLTPLVHVAFLARLMRSAGVGAARESLGRATAGDERGRAVLDRALANVGERAAAEPDLAESLVAAEFVRLRGELSSLGPPRWPYQLALLRIVDLDAVPPGWHLPAQLPVVAVTARGLVVGSRSSSLLQLVDPQSGKVLTTVSLAAPVSRLATDGQVVVVGVGDSLVTVSFDRGGGAPLGSVRVDDLTVLAMTSSGPVSGHADGLVALGGPRRTLVGHAGPVLAITTLQGAIVTAGADATARVWEPDGRPRLVFHGHRAAVHHLVGTPDGSCVVSADASGVVLAWSPRDGSEVARITGHRGAVSGLALTGDGVATAGLDGRVSHTRLTRDAHTVTIRPDGAPVLCVVAGDGDVVTAEADGTVRWWVPEGERVSARPEGVAAPVQSMVYVGHRAVLVHDAGVTAVDRRSISGRPSPDSSLQQVPGRSGIIRTTAGGLPAEVDLRTGTVRRITTGETADPLPGDDVLSASAGPQVVRGGTDGTVALVDQGGSTTLIGRHEGPVSGVCVVPGDRALAVTGAADGMVRAWDLGSRRCVAALACPAPIVGLVSAGDGLVAARTAAGELWVLRAAPALPGRLPDPEDVLSKDLGIEIDDGADDGRWRMVVSIDLGLDVDLLAVDLRLEPERSFDGRPPRLLVAPGSTTDTPVPAVPLEERIPLPDGRCELRFTARWADMRDLPVAATLVLVVTSPRLGGDVMTEPVPLTFPTEPPLRPVTARRRPTERRKR